MSRLTDIGVVLNGRTYDDAGCSPYPAVLVCLSGEEMKRLSLAGTELESFHVCAFFNSRDEEYQIVAPFVKEGLDQQEKNLHIVNPAMAEDHRARLQHAGIDTHQCEACGQLDIVPWENAYLDESGVFDKDRMLATVDFLTGAGRDAGFERVRIMGNMDWVFKVRGIQTASRKGTQGSAAISIRSRCKSFISLINARGAARPDQAGVSFPSLPWSASELAPKARLQTFGALPATLGTTAVAPKLTLKHP